MVTARPLTCKVKNVAFFFSSGSHFQLIQHEAGLQTQFAYAECKGGNLLGDLRE